MIATLTCQRDLSRTLFFWLCKDENYYTLFIDPKGITHTEFGYKVDGYERIFKDQNGCIKVFHQNGFKIRVFLRLYAADRIGLPERMYKEYWFDSIHKSISSLLTDSTSAPTTSAITQ